MRIRATETRPETLEHAIECLATESSYAPENYYMRGWQYWVFRWRKGRNLTLTFQEESAGEMPEKLVRRFEEMEKKLKRWKYLGRWNHIILEYTYCNFSA